MQILKLYPQILVIETQVVALIKTIDERRVLKGIFHLAGILDDGILRNKHQNDLKLSFSPKANAAHYLHEATDKKLKFRLFCIIFIDCVQYGFSLVKATMQQPMDF